jgi:AcrR family transcriptional regulator
MTEAEAREQILKTAIRLFNEKGFASVRINDIVRESGLSKGGVYWHFESKDDIIQAVLDSLLEEQLVLVNHTLSGGGTASEKLRSIFQFSGAELQATMPSPLEFYAMAARDEKLKQRLIVYFETYRQKIRALIQQGIDEGEFAPWDADTLSTTLVGFLEGIIMVGLTVLTPEAFAAQLQQVADFMLRGLLKR